ncbi:unnamed protein product [Brugia pahangi]|uniref:SHSP domain-containing protein n=1 Tax=Brugia pahangi TaxID=6280 RepID=A0A0N4TVV9_BRUPA|nr:unnamed protein product [Brugia pahangi]
MGRNTRTLVRLQAHHNERNDQSGRGSIERHFVRKYVMPEEVQTDTIESHLSDKGVLTICATKTMIGSLHEVPLFEHAQRNRK